jgi:subtilase family serine protease
MVDFPCSDPEVTCVGGTTVQDASTGDYGSETVWADGSDPTNPEGSGGGISQLFNRPPWQTGPGTDNSYSAADNGRMVPDVSADADPQTGYAVFIVNVHLVGEDDEYGGTSAAAPLWSGLIALLVQSVGRRIGFFNPTLYALGAQAASFPAAPFHDITTGNNLYYPATPGYDLATGWGTPDGAALAADLKQLGQIVLVPIVVVKAAHVQQMKNGKYVTVKTVARGKSARFMARYSVTNPNGPVTGKLKIVKSGRSVGTWKLSSPGSPSGTVKRNVTLRKAGNYSAVFTLSNGGYSTPVRVKFKVK